MADVKRTIELVFAGTDTLSDKVATISKSFDQAQDSIDNFATPIAGATEHLLQLEAAVVAVGAAMATYALSQAIQFQDATTELDKVLGDTDRSIQSFADSAIELSNTFGSAAVEVQGSFAAFASAGFAADEIEGLTENILKFARVSELDATAGTEALVRILKGFNAEAKETPAILDIINENTNKYATNTEQLTEALARSSAIAKQGNFTIGETVGVLTPIVEVFQNAEIAGTAFNSVMQRLTSDTKDVVTGLENLGVAQKDSTGALRSSRDILFDVMHAYESLAPSQKAVTTQMLAGTEQGAKFGLVFDNLTKVTQATADSLAGVGHSVENELKKRMADTSASIDIFTTRLQNAAIVAGREFLPGVKTLADALASAALQFQDFAKTEAFKTFAAVVNQQLASAGQAFAQFAAALPEALKQVNFGDFLDQLRQLGVSFGGLFSDIDLTTPAGLARVLQEIVDVATNVIAFNRGIVEALAPVIASFRTMFEIVSELNPAFFTFAGVIAGGTVAWTALSPAVNLALAAFKGFGQLIGAGGTLLRDLDNVGASIGKLKSGPTSIAALALAAAAAGYEIGTLLNDYVINPLTKSTTGFDTLGEAIFNWVNNPAAALLSKQDALAASMGNLTKAHTDHTVALDASKVAWDVYGGGIDAVTGKFAPFSQAAKDFTLALDSQHVTVTQSQTAYQQLTAELERTQTAYAAVLQTLDPFAEAISAQGLAWKSAAERVDLAKGGYESLNGVWTQTKNTGTELAQTTQTVGEKAAKAAEESAKLALESEKLDLEWAKLASNEREIVFKASVDLQIAQVEAQAEQFKAIMESLNTSIESTGDTMLGLAKLFAESSNKFGVGSEIAGLLRKEEERRAKAFELQEKLINQQLRYLEVSTNKLASGDALITINAEGIEPELKEVLFKIIELAHLEASQAAGPLLLGLPNL